MDNILEKCLISINEKENLCYLENIIKEKTKIDEKKYIFDYCIKNIDDANCLYLIGLMYDYDEDHDNCLYYYTKSADLGNSYSMVMLAKIYVKKDLNKTISFYEKAIELNNPVAMNELGMMYQNGKGVKASIEKAFELYEKGANLECFEAMNNLGFMYENGFGCEKNYEKAFELYNKSLKFNNVTALSNLAMMYLKGRGTEKNIYKAVELLTECAIKGDDESKKYLGTVIKNNIDIFIDKTKIVNELEKKIVDLETYITHLETLPLGKEYQNALEEFNNLCDKNDK